MASKERASGFVDNWQNGKTLPECNLHMLETEDFCDVSFRVGSDGHVIRAHRYVLVSRSCVFHVMFCGPMAEQGEITIPDIEADVFKDFLRFLYTDSVVLSFGNAPGLLYTSRKYDVDALFRQCASFLNRSLTESNVCEILENCHGYGEIDLVEKAFDILIKSGEVILKTPGFLKLCPPCLEMFLSSDDLHAKEEDIFEATLSWAKVRCEVEKIEPSPVNQRKVLGDLIYQIRFPAFSRKYLTSAVLKSEILTTEERMSFIKRLDDPHIDITPFSAKPRNVIKQYVSRFKKDWTGDSGFPCKNVFDCVSFHADKDIVLIGCQVYGPVHFTQGLYTVTVRLYDDQGAIISKQYKAKSVPLKSRRELNDIMLPEPFAISAWTTYTLAVCLKGGSNHNLGSNGARSIKADGVTFNFMDSNLSVADSRTNADRGQIPGLIWKQL